jgi:hypothetical protein
MFRTLESRRQNFSHFREKLFFSLTAFSLHFSGMKTQQKAGSVPNSGRSVCGYFSHNLAAAFTLGFGRKQTN